MADPNSRLHIAKGKNEKAADTLLERLRGARLQVDILDRETALIAGRFEINTATATWKAIDGSARGYGPTTLIEAARKVAG